ncbi:MAG TPA: hypothetical protein VFS49_00260 [Croceibacterium sp.]|nr:hypothetical protein [Croceibacterium sp.]
MKSKLWMAPILALGLVGAPALAGDRAEPPADKQAHIAFVNYGGIDSWHFGDRETLYLKDRHGRWYKATLMTPVPTWRSQWAIGFETRGIDTFGRFSTVIVDGWRHPVESLVRIDGRPPRHGEPSEPEA